MSKINIFWVQETADPDDVFTLCLLATHPKVNLLGVSVVPGSKQQIALIKHILKELSISVPVGSKTPNHPKSCVSEWHYKWLGNSLSYQMVEPDALGEEILKNALNKQNTKILTGASLSSVGKMLEIASKEEGSYIEEIIVQGGFAGDSVVPIEYRLDKFKGKETCPTFNLNGDIPAAKIFISTPIIKLKRFVSKNVCHGVIYNNEMHERIKLFKNNNAGLNMLVKGMEFYLNKNNKGKAFHDPLAACVAIDPSVCNFKEVEIYREKGEWGSRISENTNTFISISVDKNKFENTLVGI